MKKLIFIISATLITVNTNAQMEKGRYMLGSYIYYNQNNDATDKDNNSGSKNKFSNVSIDLNVGYFLSDKFVLGPVFNYQNYSNDNIYPTSHSKSNNHTYDAGIFSRYYGAMNNSKFVFLGELTATYTFGNSTTTSTYSYYLPEQSETSNGDLTGFKSTLTFGIGYFFSRRFGIETFIGNLSYGYSTIDNVINNAGVLNSSEKNTQTKKQFNARLNSLSLGISYYFGQGKVETKN
jgi:hypothetical protein